MGYRLLSLQLPTDFDDGVLEKGIARKLGIRRFSYTIESKSLDARNKRKIHWLVRVGVSSTELSNTDSPASLPSLDIPSVGRSRRAIVVGSGPAGLFAALVLQQAGYDTTILERGQPVEERAASIRRFETGGNFDAAGNYAFGEGGAGTFSDGKLTARTKNIRAEKRYIFEHYIAAGAPREIAYLAHPHIGTDKLRHVAVNLRKLFVARGGTIHFATMMTGLVVTNGRVEGITTSSHDLGTDLLLVASGHSAHETYRMLMAHGVRFRTKNFAIGCRVEHPQEMINRAQWGSPLLAGVKAAEYRLTTKQPNGLPVFTFCMCPGGTVVPATAYSQRNIVNGMSRYARNGRFANAACVAGINLAELLGREIGPQEALDWLDGLERQFYRQVDGYRAPFATIRGFGEKRLPQRAVESSYSLGLEPAPLWEMLPAPVASALTCGLADFSRKIHGFEEGIILGLESKTSSPLQALRDDRRRCPGFTNLYIAGEGSGWAGGIVSSGVDGIRTALAAIANNR